MAAKEASPAVAQPAPAGPAATAGADKQSKALEALRQAEAAPVVTNQVTQKEAARWQQEQDELKIKKEKDAKRAAAEQARIAKAKKEADDAAARKKAREEAARREPLKKKEMKNAPAPAQAAAKPPPANTNALSAKEQKLADLLRRYQADEITPYEYHLERAKIVAEP